MRALAFLQEIPPLSPVASRLDARRGARVQQLLRTRSDTVASLHGALAAMVGDPGSGRDPGHVGDLARAGETIERAAADLLGQLRDADGDVVARLDRSLRSDAPELLDRDDVPRAIKGITMRLLHRTNALAGSYDAWTEEVQQALGPGDAEAHVYDLAAGTGGYARHLASHPAQRRRVRITSSDLSADYVAIGAGTARREGLSGITWEPRDALVLGPLAERGDVDLFLCTQAAHHLSPGQLVRMIAGAIHAAPRGILVIDLMRSASNAIGTLAVAAVLAPFPPLMFDGFQSVRRAYTPAELTLLARLAGATDVRARLSGPAWCVLTARS